MALEKRNGKLYYYRSVREGERVRKVYLGAGDLARIARDEELMSRALKVAERERQREEVECLEVLAAPVAELCEISEIIARAHLVAAGCHRHKGEWRRQCESA